MLKITIIYDNTKINQNLTSDWGFACLIESEKNYKMLFDTGACGHILLNNMEVLKINPKSINFLFLSHDHFDHVGGLSEIIYQHSELKIFSPYTLKGLTRAKNVIEINKKPREIEKNIFTTGLINNIEQSLILKSSQGLIIITGCSHPGISKIIKIAKKIGKIHSIIGGFHNFSNLKLLKNIPIICPTHCTKKIKEIKKLFPNQYITGGAGKTIIFE